jgi:hypothetical protein
MGVWGICALEEQKNPGGGSVGKEQKTRILGMARLPKLTWKSKLKGST